MPADTYEWSQPEVSGISPGAVAAHSSVAIGNKIYFFGGLCAADEKELASRSLHFLDTGEQQTPPLGTCNVIPFYSGFYLVGGGGRGGSFSPKSQPSPPQNSLASPPKAKYSVLLTSEHQDPLHHLLPLTYFSR